MTFNIHRYSSIVASIGIAVCALTIAAQATAAQISAQIKDAAGQSIADAVIYATLTSGTAPTRPKREVSVEQINKEFVPLVSVLQSGTLVNFPNRDKVRHHVYSFSQAKTFEIKLYSGVPGSPILFDKPGEIVLGCNIHDSMLAYMLVVDTPFFAKSDPRGAAVIDGLPAGEYEVQLWYPGTASSARPAAQKIKLSASESASLAFVFSSRPLNPAALKPGTGK
jgi:plastocyanin